MIKRMQLECFPIHLIEALIFFFFFFNLMFSRLVISDFGAQESSLLLFPLFPHLFTMK